VSRPNHAILLTPPGAAAIAVVRLTGPGVEAFLAQHFSRTTKIGRCVHGELRDGERVLDDPVVVHVAADVVDINLHGGPWVVTSVIELARRAGFEHVNQSPEAVDGDTELQREVLAHLPQARTEQAIRVLLAQPAAWAEFVGRQPSRDEIEQRSSDDSMRWLLHPPRVAIVGAPNVGKSTLANQLFAQERSITADVPGTTRDWVGEIANLDGLAVMLVDTPGVRETDDAIERVAIARSGEEVERADLVVVVLDGSRPTEPEQSTMMARHPNAIVVWNKADRQPREAPAGAIATVATTGAGVDDLRRAIRVRFGWEAFDTHRPRWWTKRQRGLLDAARADVSRLMNVVTGTA
jgi:tRNA modification GTPase